tara:strand:- start:1773 stop:3242 length:1470 start_codon:yes stop_codon:yes gene_type:complete
MSKVLLVVEDPAEWSRVAQGARVLSLDTYLADYPVKGERSTRVINLCGTSRYLSKGYYCSLLAEARGHRVVPSVNTLIDLGNQELYLLQTGSLPDLERPGLDGLTVVDDTLSFRTFFGRCSLPELSGIASKLFEQFPCPILDVKLVWRGQWQVGAIQVGSFASLNAEETSQFHGYLESFAGGLWRGPKRLKSSRWDLAILVNPEEKLPPSDAQALKRMQRAAEKLGLATELILPSDYPRLAEFDALFIRETTEIDHHTYRFARAAELEGLVVIDDPTSILRCCNKVFLQDAFTYQHVPTPKTRIVSGYSEAQINQLELEFGYPMVLKIPNSAFSLGVTKVADRAELSARLREYLERSDLVIAQEFLYTEYDWRIGVLNHRPLYACRYYMARNHWQIYKHGGSRVDSGKFETLPTFEVPRPVLDAALKAAAIIGDGFYGIDLKQHGNKVYVIEVNDNPSLDHGVEDAFVGDELYMQLMGEFVRRLEERGR